MDSIFSFSRPGIGFTIVYALVEAVVFSALIWLWEVSENSVGESLCRVVDWMRLY